MFRPHKSPLTTETILNNVTPLFSQSAREEFYSLRGGSALARVVTNDGLLSSIVVTDTQSEGIDNRAYMPILKGHAVELTRAQYETRRTALRGGAPAPVAA